MEGYTYTQWLAEFNPEHVGTEEVFNANLASIKAHNVKKGETYKQGVKCVSQACPPPPTLPRAPLSPH